MTRPHSASPAATAVDLILVTVALGGFGYLAVAAVQAVRRARAARRWPRPRKSWLRDFHAEVRDRGEGES